MYENINDIEAFEEFTNYLQSLVSVDGDLVELFYESCPAPGHGFWAYHPAQKTWQHLGYSSSVELPMPEGVPDAVRDAYSQALLILPALPRPPLPEELSTVIRQPPFLYEGFPFQWIFLPELKRWEILPLPVPEDMHRPNGPSEAHSNGKSIDPDVPF